LEKGDLPLGKICKAKVAREKENTWGVRKRRMGANQGDEVNARRMTNKRSEAEKKTKERNLQLKKLQEI